MFHRQRKEDGQEGPDRPGHLEPPLEFGERPTVVRPGRVPLDQRIEGQLGRPTAQGDHPPYHHGAPDAPEPCGQRRAAHPDEQDPADEPLLRESETKPRRQGGAQERPDANREEHQAEVPDRCGRTPQDVLTPHDAGGGTGGAARSIDRNALLAAPELERQEERREPDHRPEHADGRRRGPDALLAECGDLACGGPSFRHEHRRHPPCQAERERIADHRDPRRSSRSHQQSDSTQSGTEHAPHCAQHRQLGIRLDQLQLVADQRRHHGTLGDRVALLQHQQAEGQRKEQQAVKVGGHLPCDEPTPDDRYEDHSPAPAPDAVHQRSNQRCDHGKRGDGQDQVDSDAPPGCIRIDGEEDRAGQGHRDHGVRHGPDRMHPGESREGAHGAPVGRVGPIGGIGPREVGCHGSEATGRRSIRPLPDHPARMQTTPPGEAARRRRWPVRGG